MLFRTGGMQTGMIERRGAYAGMALAGLMILSIALPSYAQDSWLFTREVGEVSILRVVQCDEVNPISTHQNSRVNIKTSVQCGQQNTNVTYQEGAVNINRSIQCGPENETLTRQIGGVNRNRVVQTQGDCGAVFARTQTADSRHRNAPILQQRERRGR